MSTLLHAIIDDAPRLDGALCRGQAPWWDAEDPGYVDRAIAGCLHACPALALCRSWYSGLPPSRRPISVVAGVMRPRAPAPKYDSEAVSLLVCS
jgi:hypothetical protein